MIIFGIGQGLGLSTLTTAGMAGVAPKDAGVAGGLVNVAHHNDGALGLGILVTVFAAAGTGAHGPQQLLADRVSASLTGAAIFLAAALLLTLITQRRAPRTALDSNRLAAAQNLAHPGAEVLTETRAAA
jgi:protein-S-isoprenylcysteine O-methyltransferase Ste14